MEGKFAHSFYTAASTFLNEFMRKIKFTFHKCFICARSSK